jgi:hypothetical protein
MGRAAKGENGERDTNHERRGYPARRWVKFDNSPSRAYFIANSMVEIRYAKHASGELSKVTDPYYRSSTGK